MAKKVTQKTILLVNAGSLRKKFILEKIKKMNVSIVCLDQTKKEFANPYIDHWILTDLMDEKKSIAAVKRFLSSNANITIDGAITFWDECVILTAALAETFKWAGIAKKVTEKIKNKFLFRKFCKDNKLPTTVNKKITAKNQTQLKKMPYPMVIKPIFGVCSAFVKKVNSYEEITAAIKDMTTNKNNFFRTALWKDWGVMVEEYIEGQEVDIDILVQSKKIKYLVITDNHPTKEPYFLETGQNMPSWLSSHDQESLTTLAQNTVKKFGISDGCVHFEAKITKKGPMPIEINLRMGGGDVYLFSKQVWGVDLIENAVLIALGVKVEIKKPKKPLQYLLGEQFLSDKSVIIKKIKINEKIKQKKYLTELFFEKKEGDTFLAPPRGFDSNIGWIVVSGKNQKECRERLAEIKELIHIETTPLP